jgi:hypothetical protein
LHGVHGNPVGRLVECGQKPNDFKLGLLTKDVECPGDILAGIPGEEDL